MSLSLGPGPVVIPLSAWTEESISAIYKAPNQAEFSSAFDSFLNEEAHITVNGKRLNRTQYKGLLQGERALEQGADVSFTGAVEVPADPNEPASAGTVGIFYKATIYKTIKVIGASVSSTVTSSLNVVVKEGDDPEDRSVVAVNQVITDEANPADPPHALTSS